MADYEWKVESNHRMVYSTPSPAVGAEVGKMFSGIMQDASDNEYDTSWDDFFTWESYDDEIRVSYKMRNDDKRLRS